ncbi:hypothetical protein JW977_03170 [Candidatus Falkowbacteria bacterium]|nr:hypothetical protein [Candidatus Falkowbacteria bacterium]
MPILYHIDLLKDFAKRFSIDRFIDWDSVKNARIKKGNKGLIYYFEEDGCPCEIIINTIKNRFYYSVKTKRLRCIFIGDYM